MHRTLIERLNAWKLSPTRQPLILRGARQVGKTWLLKEFGRTSYESCAYVNFDANSRMQRLFAEDLDPARIIEGLQIECRQTIVPGKTLLVFDEVQEAPKALASLKYFAEQAPDQHIVAAGSLLGIALHQGASFPVGKVEFLDLRPLSFREFLLATGEERLLAPLEREDWSLVGALRERYVACLRQHFFTGGMPEAVLAFAARRDLTEVREVQRRLLAAYEQDFSKHAPHAVVPRIRLLWNSLPAQLARENRKFVYGVVKPGARAREYELALAWLADCGLVHKVQRISRPLPPLRAQADFSSFKLFHLDVGLLARMCNLDPQALLDGDRLFREFSGALTEQYCGEPD